MRGLEIAVTGWFSPKAPPGSDCSTNTPPVTHIPGDGKTHTSIGLCSAIIFAKAFHSYPNSRCSHKPTVLSALTSAHNMPIEPHSDILTHTHRSPSVTFLLLFSHLCFHLNLHSYQSPYCFCCFVSGKVICHDLFGQRNCFSSEDGKSRRRVQQRMRSYSWGRLCFCSHSVSL